MATASRRLRAGATIVYPNKYYEKNVTSDVVTSHYYLGGQQIAIKKGSTLEYLHQDSLNSSSVSTANDGSQVSKTVFLPFGATRSSTGTLGTDQLYTGQRLDGTGLYFYNARYYDAGVGRFISPDSTGQTLTNPQTLNRYTYVYNNPLTYNDPTGHWGWSNIKNAAKSLVTAVLAPIVQPIQNVMVMAGALGIDATVGVGINVQVTGPGVGASGSVGLVFDTQGAWGVNYSGGGGGAAGSSVAGANVAGQVTVTNASSITQLSGPTAYVGGSGGAANIVGGGEYLTGDGYQGFDVQVGFNPSPAPGFEMHGILETGGVIVMDSGASPTKPPLPDNSGSDMTNEDPF